MFEHLTRREFARLSFGTAAFPLASLSEAALAQQPAARAETVPKNSANAPESSPAAKPLTQADLLAEIVRLRYPDERLTDAVLEHIRGEIEADLLRAAVLKRFPLRNADPPAFVFAGYRAD